MISKQQTQYEIVNFTGGLNEQVSNLELTPGELTICQNYIERDDLYGGYESVPGYERFDGQPKPSSVPADEADDVAREAARSLIQAVPGSGPIRGIFMFNDEVYACRNNEAEDFKGVYKESSTGWEEVPEFFEILSPNGKIRTVRGRFSQFASNNEVIIITDEESNAQIWDGTTLTEIPEPDTAIGFPTNVAIFKNRLILAFPNGNLVFSSVGDPTDFDTSTGTAGRVKVGDTITSIQETKGGILVISGLTNTKLMYYGGTSDDETFIFKLDTFSDSLGAYSDTMKPLLGTTMLADVSGVTTLTAVDTYGDFKESNLTKKVQTSFDASKIVGAVTDREKGRYILYFSDASRAYALVLSMKGARIKSITKILYKRPISYVTNVVMLDGTEKIFFGSTNGLVYEAFIGTSSDGGYIESALRSAFYHYKSPRIWKRFSKIYFEIMSTSTFEVSVLPLYNYNQPSLPRADIEDGLEAVEDQTGPKWGSSTWGSFTWKRGEVESSNVYISGYGSNMAVSLQSKSKYADPHVIYNMQVSFTLNSQHL